MVYPSVPAYPGSPGKKAVKRLCVCVYIAVCLYLACHINAYSKAIFDSPMHLLMRAIPMHVLI